MKRSTTLLAAALMVTAITGDTLAGEKRRPWNVIENANRESAQNPDSYGYHNAIMRYDFEDGELYQVYAAPLKLTDIQLEP